MYGVYCPCCHSPIGVANYSSGKEENIHVCSKCNSTFGEDEAEFFPVEKECMFTLVPYGDVNFILEKENENGVNDEEYNLPHDVLPQ